MAYGDTPYTPFKMQSDRVVTAATSYALDVIQPDARNLLNLCDAVAATSRVEKATLAAYEVAADAKEQAYSDWNHARDAKEAATNALLVRLAGGIDHGVASE